MKKRLGLFCLCLFSMSLNAQSYKGFDFFFNGGMYKGHAYHATYYNGANEEINIQRILGNKILKDQIDQLVAEKAGVTMDSKGVFLEELPQKMHYDWCFQFGGGFAYRITPNLALTGTFGQVKLRAAGTAVFGYNKGVIGNQSRDYLNYPLIGKERRSFLDIGIRYTQPSETSFSWFYEGSLQLNNVKVENADLVVEGESFTMIDYYGGANYDPTVTQIKIDPMLGGTGFGASACIGLQMKINQWAFLAPYVQCQYSRIHLGSYLEAKPDYILGVRILLKDYVFA
ncbi:MAG: hypothetical protein J5873_04810 [Bacteroidales bacterium]|nr:hypothetical protein [Bacteroidales bacterium]